MEEDTAQNKTATDELDGSPAERVFNTFELLDAILLHLPLESIIDLRSVSRHTNATVLSSLPIQRKLFLIAEPPTEFWVCSDSATHRKCDGDMLDDSDVKVMPAVISQALFDYVPTYARDRVRRKREFRLHRQPALSKPGSLYQNMLVCQPPATSVKFRICYKRPNGDSPQWAEGTAENDAGVPLKDIVDAFVCESGGVRPTKRSGSRIAIVNEGSRLYAHGVVFQYVRMWSSWSSGAE